MNDNSSITIDQLKEALKDFFDENDLIITSREEIRADIVKKQIAYLRKKFLTVSEVMDGKFFPQVKTRQTIINWMKKGKLKENQDWFYNKKGSRVILTSYLRKQLDL